MFYNASCSVFCIHVWCIHVLTTRCTPEKLILTHLGLQRLTRPKRWPGLRPPSQLCKFLSLPPTWCYTVPIFHYVKFQSLQFYLLNVYLCVAINFICKFASRPCYNLYSVQRWTIDAPGVYGKPEVQPITIPWRLRSNATSRARAFCSRPTLLLQPFALLVRLKTTQPWTLWTRPSALHRTLLSLRPTFPTRNLSLPPTSAQ